MSEETAEYNDENDMEIGETYIFTAPCLHPKLDVEITRTSANTFSYRIIEVVIASDEFNSFQKAKEEAQKEMSKI